MQLLERARQLLVDDRDRGDERGEKREHEAERARYHEGGAVERRVEEDARDDFHAVCGEPGARRGATPVRALAAAGRDALVAHERGAGRGRDALEKPFGVAGDDGLAAVVEDLDLGRPSARGLLAQLAIEVRRDDDRGADPAGDERPLDAVTGGESPRRERAVRRELGDEAAARRGAARVVHAEREILYVHRQRIAEGEERPERYRDQHRDRERIAQRGARLAAHQRPQPSPPHREARRRRRAHVDGVRHRSGSAVGRCGVGSQAGRRAIGRVRSDVRGDVGRIDVAVAVGCDRRIAARRRIVPRRAAAVRLQHEPAKEPRHLRLLDLHAAVGALPSRRRQEVEDPRRQDGRPHDDAAVARCRVESGVAPRGEGGIARVRRRPDDHPITLRVATTNRVGRRVRDQLAGVDEAHPVAVLDLLEEVRRHEHGDARFRLLLDQVPEAQPILDVDAGRRLVEEEDARPMQRAEREPRPLPQPRR